MKNDGMVLVQVKIPRANYNVLLQRKVLNGIPIGQSITEALNRPTRNGIK